MPEGLEAEIWRGALEAVVGRRIAQVTADPRVAPPDLAAVVVGSVLTGVRRRGKVVLLDTALDGETLDGEMLDGETLDGRAPHGAVPGATIGVHFGMTGQIEVDGAAPIERLAYASGADRPEWDRLVVVTDPGSSAPAIRMNDPRRLGRVSLDPDLDHLGPDLFGLTASVLGPRLARRRIAVKSALLDQTVVAGLGNMCADELLWWAGIAPHRPAASLARAEVVALAGAARRRLPIMLRRGGSDTGVLDPPVRAACPPCPRDGTPLRRTSLGGRTAVWCPHHQH